MTKPIARDAIYRKRVFDAEIIALCVRWYITYRLSHRDLLEMLAERGVKVAHSTILRRVTRYVPEYEKRWNRYSRPVGTSWRTDETYIPFEANDTTSIERSTSRERRSTFFCAVTAALRQRKRSFARRVFPASVHYESHSRLIMFLPHSARVMMGGRDGESDGRHQDAGARIISDA